MALGKDARAKSDEMALQGRARDIPDYSDYSSRFRGYGNDAAATWGEAQGWGLGEMRGMYDELSSGGGGGGGIPGYGGQYDQYKKWYDTVGELGGANAEQVDAMRGYGQFKNFANTGGWSDADKNDFRARADSGTPQLFEGIRNEMTRRGTVQGGYGVGGGTALESMARQQAEQMRQSRLGAEGHIADSVREGQKWGASSGSEAEQKVFQNMLTGQQGGMGIAERIAAENRAAASSRASSGRQNMQDRMGMIDAYTGLARQTGGQVAYGEQELAGYGGRTSADLGYQQAYQQGNQKGAGVPWGAIAGAVGTIGGGVAIAM